MEHIEHIYANAYALHEEKLMFMQGGASIL